MPTTRTVVVGLVVLLACSGTAIAQSAGPGFYAGFRVGTATMATPTRDRNGGGFWAYDQDTFTWAVFGGRDFRVAPYLLLGVEFGYSDHGAASLTYVNPDTYDFKSTGFDVLGSVSIVRRRLAVGIKAGMGHTREQYRLFSSGSGAPSVVSEYTKNLPVVAATFGYGITKHLSFYMDLRRTFGDQADTLAKTFVNSTPAPAPNREVLNSVSRVSGLSSGLMVRF